MPWRTTWVGCAAWACIVDTWQQPSSTLSSGECDPRRCAEMRQVGMPDVEFGEEYGAGAATLHVAYCKHAYGLGEHYNSLQPLGAEGGEADEEVEEQEED